MIVLTINLGTLPILRAYQNEKLIWSRNTSTDFIDYIDFIVDAKAFMSDLAIHSVSAGSVVSGIIDIYLRAILDLNNDPSYGLSLENTLNLNANSVAQADKSVVIYVDEDTRSIVFGFDALAYADKIAKVVSKLRASSEHDTELQSSASELVLIKNESKSDKDCKLNSSGSERASCFVSIVHNTDASAQSSEAETFSASDFVKTEKIAQLVQSITEQLKTQVARNIHSNDICEATSSIIEVIVVSNSVQSTIDLSINRSEVYPISIFNTILAEHNTLASLSPKNEIHTDKNIHVIPHDNFTIVDAAKTYVNGKAIIDGNVILGLLFSDNIRLHATHQSESNVIVNVVPTMSKPDTLFEGQCQSKSIVTLSMVDRWEYPIQDGTNLFISQVSFASLKNGELTLF